MPKTRPGQPLIVVLREKLKLVADGTKSYSSFDELYAEVIKETGFKWAKSGFERDIRQIEKKHYGGKYLIPRKKGKRIAIRVSKPRKPIKPKVSPPEVAAPPPEAIEEITEGDRDAKEAEEIKEKEKPSIKPPTEEEYVIEHNTKFIITNNYPKADDIAKTLTIKRVEPYTIEKIKETINFVWDIDNSTSEIQKIFFIPLIEYNIIKQYEEIASAFDIVIGAEVIGNEKAIPELKGAIGIVKRINPKDVNLEFTFEKEVELAGQKIEAGKPTSFNLPINHIYKIIEKGKMPPAPPPPPAKLKDIDAVSIIFETATKTDWFRGETEEFIFIVGEPPHDTPEEKTDIKSIQLAGDKLGTDMVVIDKSNYVVDYHYDFTDKNKEVYNGKVKEIKELTVKEAKDLIKKLNKEREARIYKLLDVSVGIYREINGKKELIGVKPDLSIEVTEVVI